MYTLHRNSGPAPDDHNSDGERGLIVVPPSFGPVVPAGPQTSDYTEADVRTACSALQTRQTDVMADTYPQDEKCSRKKVAVPSWISDGQNADVAAIVNDFDSLGSVAQARACARVLYAIGGFTQSRVALPLVGHTFTGFFTPDASPLALGIRIDWGVSLLSYAPFDLTIATAGFGLANIANPKIPAVLVAPFTNMANNAGGVPLFSVDRNVTIRVAGKNGGSIFLPFAQRRPGMSEARSVLGIPRADVDPDTGAGVLISNVPAAIEPSFSATASLMCAHHINTAAYLRALRASG